MPPKQIQVQIHIHTEEEWRTQMEKQGLHLVDAYVEWSGPCKSVTSLFKKIKMECGDSLLHFETAPSEQIAQLEPYRGRCQPAFLLFAGGCLVGAVHGCNGPKLEQVIKRELEKEKKILESGLDRIPFEDSEMLQLKQLEANLGCEPKPEETAKEEIVPVRKEFTICIIKPDVVAAGKVDEVISLIRARFIDILAQKQETLSEEVVRELYSHLLEESFFPDLLSFMTGGPSVILLLSKMGLTGHGIVDEFREVIGPFDTEQAKAEFPQSLRALYGTSSILNAVHSSASVELAARELAFFFPQSAVPYVRGTVPEERTLALIRPDALAQHKDALLEKIREAGFEISFAREVELSREQVEGFFADQREEEGFEKLVTDMSSVPVLALCLSGKDVVQRWVQLIQPLVPESAETEGTETDTGRRPSILGMISDLLPESPAVPVYGSSSAQNALSDMDTVFPEQETIAVIKPNAFPHKDTIIDKIQDLGFSVKAQKEQVFNQELFEAFYKQHEGQEFYENLKEFMTSGPSMVLLLSDRNAISKWREAMGPIEPTEGLRGVFGRDAVANGLHGTSNDEKVEEFAKLFFSESNQVTSEMENKEDDQETTEP